MTDLGDLSLAAPVPAADVSLADSGGNTSETDVEGAIAELYGLAGGGGGLFSAYAQLSHTLSSGTDGGTSVDDSWQTRPLNTEDFDPSGIVSLSSNQFVLAAGTYFVDGGAWFEIPDSRLKLRIRNITDSSTPVVGITFWVPGTSNSEFATVRGRFTLAGTKTLELQYFIQTAFAGDGLGANYGATGEVEKYAHLMIYKES